MIKNMERSGDNCSLMDDCTLKGGLSSGFPKVLLSKLKNSRKYSSLTSKVRLQPRHSQCCHGTSSYKFLTFYDFHCLAKLASNSTIHPFYRKTGYLVDILSFCVTRYNVPEKQELTIIDQVFPLRVLKESKLLSLN